MSAPLVAPSIDGPSPLLTRVAAQLERAEARDRVFVTIPVESLRALVTLARCTAGPLEQALAEAERDAATLPAEHRAAYLNARMEQIMRGLAVASEGNPARPARRAAGGRR